MSSLPSFYPRLFLPKCITQCHHAPDTWVTHAPGGHSTLGARDFSSSVSGFCQVFILTRFAACGFGLRPKMCRPSANTENSRRTREEPLVPRVGPPGAYRAFSHDVTAAMFVYPENLLGVELFSHVNAFFCSLHRC